MDITSRKQFEQLLELGLNPNTADMYYDEYGVIRIGQPREHYAEYKEIPCWSLSALLDLMPKNITSHFGNINPFIGQVETGDYRCVYLNGDWESDHQTFGTSALEAAYNMVVWLLKNDLIK